MPFHAAAQLSEWTMDPLGAEMLNEPVRPWPIQLQREFFARQLKKPDQALLGFWTKEASRLIGFFLIETQPQIQTYLLTTLVGDKKWRGTRLIDEVSDPVHDHFFNRLGFAKAKANVRPHNKAMLWLMANGGWRKEAHLKEHLRDSATGQRVDVLVMGLLAEDWRKDRELLRQRRMANALKAKGSHDAG